MFKAIKICLAILTFVSFALFFHWKFALLIMLSISIHEYGHLMAMNFLSIKNRGFIFLPLMGGLVIPAEPIHSEMKRVFVYFAGPMAGLLSAILFLILYSISGATIFVAMASWSAVLNLVNMFPIPPFDGGMALRCALNSIHHLLGKLYTAISALAVICISTILLSIPAYVFIPFIIFSLLDLFIEFYLKRKFFPPEENIGLDKPQILITCLSFVIIILGLFTMIKYTNTIPQGNIEAHFTK